MEQSFDFEQIGKKMPYSVPDGFFEKMETEVMSQLAASQKEKQERTPHGRVMRIVKRVALAAAAVAALVLVLHTVIPRYAAHKALVDVEMAFDQLTPDDQAFLLQVYEDDVFMDE